MYCKINLSLKTIANINLMTIYYSVGIKIIKLNKTRLYSRKLLTCDRMTVLCHHTKWIVEKIRWISVDLHESVVLTLAENRIALSHETLKSSKRCSHVISLYTTES